jgi:hypothetical protein
MGRSSHDFSFLIDSVVDVWTIPPGLFKQLDHFRRFLLAQNRQLQAELLSKSILTPLGAQEQDDRIKGCQRDRASEQWERGQIDRAIAKRGGEKIHADPPKSRDSQHADEPGAAQEGCHFQARPASFTESRSRDVIETRRDFSALRGAIRTSLRVSETLEDFGGQLFAVR